MTVSLFSHGGSDGILRRHFLILLLSSVIGTRTAAANRGRRSHYYQDTNWRPAAPTGTATIGDTAHHNSKWTHLQISHTPTDAPRLPEGLLDLRRRELSIVSYATTPPGSNTCGFFTDNGGAFYCNEGYTCANIGSIRDCCVAEECATSSFSSVCLDYTDPACSKYTPGTKCCGGGDGGSPQSGFCATWVWATSAKPKDIFTLFECVEHHNAGNFSLWAEEPIFVDTVVTTTTGTGTTEGEGSPTGSSKNNGDGSGNNNSQGSMNMGAIIGGAIGGMAVLGILLLIFYYIRKRERRHAAAVGREKLRPMSGLGSGNNGEGGGGGGGMYSPAPASEMLYNEHTPYAVTTPQASYLETTPYAVTTPPAASAMMAGAVMGMGPVNPESQPLVGHAGIVDGGYYNYDQKGRIHQEEVNRGIVMNMGLGMGMGMGRPAGQHKEEAIEMSNSPTSYEVSTSPLYQELPTRSNTYSVISRQSGNGSLEPPTGGGASGS